MSPGMLAPPPPQQTRGGRVCTLHVATFFIAIRTYDQASGLAWGPQAAGFPRSPPEGSPWRTAAPAFRGRPAAPGGEVGQRAPHPPSGRLARLPIRWVLLGNGVRLCPQCPLPDDREGFLERAVRDVAARVGGTPHRRTTPDGRSVKPPGRHACCQVWEVRLPEGVAVVSLTDWNQGRRVAVPCIWIQARYGLVLQFARLFNP